MLDGVLEWCGDDELVIESAAKSFQQMTLALVGTKNQKQVRKPVLNPDLLLSK